MICREWKMIACDFNNNQTKLLFFQMFQYQSKSCNKWSKQVEKIWYRSESPSDTLWSAIAVRTNAKIDFDLLVWWRIIITAWLLHKSRQRLNNRRNFLIATHVCLLIWAEHSWRLILHNDRTWKCSEDLLQFLHWLCNKLQNTKPHAISLNLNVQAKFPMKKNSTRPHSRAKKKLYFMETLKIQRFVSRVKAPRCLQYRKKSANQHVRDFLLLLLLRHVETHFFFLAQFVSQRANFDRFWPETQIKRRKIVEQKLRS